MLYWTYAARNAYNHFGTTIRKWRPAKRYVFRRVFFYEVTMEIQIRDRRESGWFWADNEVLESGISGNALFLYLTLCRYANNDSQECWPSLSTLMRVTGRSRPTVLRSAKELESVGLIMRNRKQGSKTIYTLLKVTGKKSLLVSNRSQLVKNNNPTGKNNYTQLVKESTKNKTNRTRLNNKTNTDGLKRLEEMKKKHNLA